ncbi:hypothetical protein GQR58_030418 [Nymphon striatum]|nr:hypothetical protein GQR58_030418 [Nymphon striatum]
MVGNAGSITIASTGAGDINTASTINARNGAARGTGLAGNVGTINITNSDGNISTRNLETYGNLNGHGGNINVAAATGDVTVTGRVYSYGGTVNNGHTLAGRNGGNINISGVNRTITSRVNANGNTAKGVNQAGGHAGMVTITGAGTLNVADVYSRNGRATDAGAGGNVGSITLSGSAVTATSTVSSSGERNGDAGNINITSASGDVDVKNVYASGGGTNPNTAGNNGGTININSAGALVATNVSANGSTGNGLNQVGGNAGAINLNASNGITTNVVNASGGAGGNAAGSNADAGSAGNIVIASTGAGDITTSHVYARNGAARGAGAGGAISTINITNSDGNISTRNLETYGNLNGHGGNINVAAATGDVTVTGRVYSYGGTVNNGHTLAGRNGGNINISGVNRTITSRVNANGNTAKGVNQAGGHAGMVTITGAGTLNVADVYSRNGNATDAGAGGSVGSITLNGSTVTASSVVSTAGGRNGNGGDINLLSTTGDTSVRGAYVQGGAANTNTAGGDAGNITVNSVGGFIVTDHLYAQGASGNGDNNNGGDAGTITVNAAGAISAKRVYAYGGTGGGNNALTNTAAGGNAGSVTLNSTAAGDITLTQDVNVRTGYSRGSAPGATAGNINLTNTDGSVIIKNIRAEGQNHGDGSDVAINAGSTGDVTVNGVIYTYGDVNPTAANFVGVSAGDISITAANTTVTGAINTNGGRGRGVNQIGGDAGDVTINATGAISTQAIAANGGNAGTAAGSNAAGGSAGDINLTSTGTGDITAAAISARTGYSRGSATATGAGSVTIENDDGKLTATSISTRGQRRGVGGDVLAISAGDFNVGTVDARSSNLTGADDGAITIGTKTTGDTTVASIQTRERWLVYSGDPRNDSVVNPAFKATADFKEYNKGYGDTLDVAIGATDNGFVYRHAPVITTALTGAVSKPYDGNTAASIAGLTLNHTGGEIDGDVISISALTSATYDNKSVGVGKAVTSNPLTMVSGTNGTTAVYGYKVNAATGNVGVITESALSVAETQAEAAAENPRNQAGLGGLLDVSNQPQQFVSVFNVDATAAGGDGETEACLSEQEEKAQNPNTSIILNFGVNLPEGVKKTCI